MTPIERCDREIADAERLLLDGHPDVGGLALAVADWSEEKRMIQGYEEFLASKRVASTSAGFTVDPAEINPQLFDWQRDIVRWALKKGRAALFEDCGLGKTPQQLEWARHVERYTERNVLIVAPLAVSQQTKREGEKFGIATTVCRTSSDVRSGINITNYEMLEHFYPNEFGAIVLDESSILKGDGPMRKIVQEFASVIPYRLACTATPAPNDHMELGNHAEFLGIMSKAEMLSMFFVHDGGETAKWRLKGHAVRPFWEFIASFAVMIRKPSDLGYDDGAFLIPPIRYHQHVVPTEWSSEALFPVEAKALSERQSARRDSLPQRVALAADLVNGSSEEWLVWCNLNSESRALAEAIPDATEVTGSDCYETKERGLLGFAGGKSRVLVSKPSIAGFGMNFQHCRNMAFVGLSDSWEEVYQATRRCWRFGQGREVHVHFITGEAEGAVVRNIQRKEAQADEMARGMVKHMKAINTSEIHRTRRESDTYEPAIEMEVPEWLK